MAQAVLLQEVERGRVFPCPVGRWLAIGRDPASDVLLGEKSVSRRHCRVRGEPDGRLRIADLSTFGTFVAGERIGGEAYAAPGERIVLGKTFALTVVGLLDDEVSVADQEEPIPPRRFGAQWILLREIGRGGMGIVYEAWDEQRRQRCAVKWLREGGRATPDSMERFMKEAMLQGALQDYPGVVRTHDLGTVTGSGEMFCVMEYVEGRSLLHRMKEGLERVEGVRLVARVARAVQYAHERGIVHRDLKPGNVLVTREGAVRLTDFGISKVLDAGEGQTVTGMMLGTPGYMAPEQVFDAKRVGPLADVYALGAVLYTVLTSKLPIPEKARSMREALGQLMKGKGAPSPRHYDPTIPADLEAICQRALAFEPEERWPSAAALAEELERWVRQADPPQAVSLSRPR